MKFSGTVKKNKRFGTTLGYPTANISFNDETKEGIYIGYTTLIKSIDPQAIAMFLDEEQKPSLIFIGSVPTLDDSKFRLESHILDFPQIDLYDAEIEVELIKKIRDNENFDSEQELIDQMKIDEKQARLWFKENSLI